MQFWTFSSTLLAAMSLGGGATALFDCNENQHAFKPKAGKFVVHYTSIRDSSFHGQPWVRICKPNGNSWINVEAQQTPCSNDPATTLRAGAIGLHHDLRVTNGNGCNKDSSNLNGASIAYNNQVAVLQASNGRCGKRDHGISCEFTLD